MKARMKKKLIKKFKPVLEATVALQKADAEMLAEDKEHLEAHTPDVYLDVIEQAKLSLRHASEALEAADAG